MCVCVCARVRLCVRARVCVCKKLTIILIPQIAKDAGLHITVHAGESGPPEHVKEVSRYVRRKFSQHLLYNSVGAA